MDVSLQQSTWGHAEENTCARPLAWLPSVALHTRRIQTTCKIGQGTPCGWPWRRRARSPCKRPAPARAWASALLMRTDPRTDAAPLPPRGCARPELRQHREDAQPGVTRAPWAHNGSARERTVQKVAEDLGRASQHVKGARCLRAVSLAARMIFACPPCVGTLMVKSVVLSAPARALLQQLGSWS